MGDDRLSVGVIGAGKVGPVIAAALANAGHTLTGINATGQDARDRVAAILPKVAFLDIDEILSRSDFVLFAIPGDQLPQLIQGLTDAHAWQPGQIVAHTAPEHGHSVFAPALAHGVIPLAIHPAIVFTGTSMDLTRLAGATVAVTAPVPVLPIAQALTVEMGAEPVTVQDADRPAYAEALDAAAVFSKAVVTQATDALTDIGVRDPHHVVGGIVRSAIEEALSAHR